MYNILSLHTIVSSQMYTQLKPNIDYFIIFNVSHHFIIIQYKINIRCQVYVYIDAYARNEILNNIFEIFHLYRKERILKLQ